MSLNVLYSTCEEALNKELFEKNKQDETGGKTCLVFVPDHARILAEKEYIQYTKNDSILSTKISNLSRHIEKELQKTHALDNKKYLTAQAKKLCVFYEINKNKELFKFFSKVKDTRGYIDKLCDMFERFEKEQVDVLKLKESLLNENTYFAHKMLEFADIYLVISKKINEKYISSSNIYDIYIEQLRKQAPSNYSIFFAHYNNFNEQEEQVIKELVSLNNDVYVTLVMDECDQTEYSSEIFNTSRNTLKRLKRLTSDISIKKIKTNNQAKTALQHLQNNIYASPIINTKVKDADETVQTIIVPNISEEVEYVANDIQQLVKKGATYNQFAIYTNNLSLYSLYIQKAFEQLNVPVYIDTKEGITTNSLVVYILSMLKLAHSGFSKGASAYVLEILKACPLYMTDEQRGILDNYILEFDIKGYEFAKEFKKNNVCENKNIYELKDLNKIREKIYNSVTQFKDEITKSTLTKYYAKAICTLLNENNVIQYYQEELAKIEEVSQEKYKKMVQVLTNIYGLMDDITLAFDSLKLDEYISLLEQGIKESMISTIPPHIDEVSVCDINKNNSCAKEYVYVLGVFDGGLPVNQSEDGIFTDNDILKLNEMGIEIKQDTLSRVLMEKFNIYSCINKAKKRITFSMPLASVTGENYSKSQLFYDIERVVKIHIEKKMEQSQSGVASFVQKLANIDIENISTNQANEIYTEYDWYKNQEQARLLFDYVRETKKLSKDTMELVYTNSEVLTSVSRLEAFATCPFNHYLTYILGIKAQEEYALSKLDLGTIMHAVVEQFSKLLIQKGITFRNIAIDEQVKEQAKGWVYSIVDSVISPFMKKYENLAKYEYQKQKLKKSMFIVICHIATSFVQSQFEQIGSEVTFEKGSIYAPIKIELSGGKSMLLRGKIDRIDRACINNKVYLKIVDYKSSARELKLKDVKDGFSLQLMSYMMTLLEDYKEGEKEIVPAAVGYITLNLKTYQLTTTEGLPQKVKEAVISAMKLNGIYISDVNILNALDNMYDNAKMSYISATPKTENKLDEETFKQECKNMKVTLKKIGEAMLEGDVKANKTQKNNKTSACAYCNFKELCNK